jgi:ferredoxin
VVRVGSDRGAEVIAGVPVSDPAAADLAARERILASASGVIIRRLDTDDLADVVGPVRHPGCLGCGRCIAWCPGGIDLTEEAAAIRDIDGAVRTWPTPPGRAP